MSIGMPLLKSEDNAVPKAKGSIKRFLSHVYAEVGFNAAAMFGVLGVCFNLKL
jgi:hypothetical protein